MANSKIDLNDAGQVMLSQPARAAAAAARVAGYAAEQAALEARAAANPALAPPPTTTPGGFVGPPDAMGPFQPLGAMAGAEHQPARAAASASRAAGYLADFNAARDAAEMQRRADEAAAPTPRADPGPTGPAVPGFDTTPPSGATPFVGPEEPMRPVPAHLAELIPGWKRGQPNPDDGEGVEAGESSKIAWGATAAALAEELGGAARGAAGTLTKLADGDNLGAVSDVAGKAAEGLGKIPVVGAALETGLKGLVGTVKLFDEVVGAFVERGKYLAQYSGELSGAGARAEVKTMMGDIREADELGPGISRLTDAQSEITDALREMLLPIKKFLIDMLAPIMEAFAEFMTWVKDALAWMRGQADKQSALLDSINKNGSKEETAKNLAEANNKLLEIKEEERRKKLEGGVNKAVAMFDEQVSQIRDSLRGDAPALGIDPVFAAAGGPP